MKWRPEGEGQGRGTCPVQSNGPISSPAWLAFSRTLSWHNRSKEGAAQVAAVWGDSDYSKGTNHNIHRGEKP